MASRNTYIDLPVLKELVKSGRWLNDYFRRIRNAFQLIVALGDYAEKLDTDLDSEIARAIAAEANLQGQITAEVTARTNGDSNLNTLYLALREQVEDHEIRIEALEA